jgi:hypothetical protein
VSKHEIEATEAYAFLNVVAPKLEQLRRRLAAASAQLKLADPEKGRLAAIAESQLALKEFLTSIPNLGALVEPLDIVLDAVREDGEGEGADEAPPSGPSAPTALEPPPPPIPVPDLLTPMPAAPPATTMPTARKLAEKSDAQHDDVWLRVGTAIVVEKLVAAGMTANNAEAYVSEAYDAIDLRQRDGGAISAEAIREWRSRFIGGGGWRRKGALKRRVGGAASAMGNPLTDAKARVDEIAMVFKKIAQLAAAKSRS